MNRYLTCQMWNYLYIVRHLDRICVQNDEIDILRSWVSGRNKDAVSEDSCVIVGANEPRQVRHQLTCRTNLGQRLGPKHELTTPACRSISINQCQFTYGEIAANALHLGRWMPLLTNTMYDATPVGAGVAKVGVLGGCALRLKQRSRQNNTFAQSSSVAKPIPKIFLYSF